MFVSRRNPMAAVTFLRASSIAAALVMLVATTVAHGPGTGQCLDATTE